jgi:co-chaperonin GroES (HSP10)
MIKSKTTIQANTFTPINDKVFVSDLDNGVKLTRGGIILPDDNMTERGIRERWCRVYAVGPDVEDLKPGDWILVQHGRWTNGIEFSLPGGNLMLWQVDYPEAVLLVSDTDPREARDHSF